MPDPTGIPKMGLLQRLFKKLSGRGQVAEVDTQKKPDTEKPMDKCAVLRSCRKQFRDAARDRRPGPADYRRYRQALTESGA